MAGRLISYLNLDDFWNLCSADEKRYLDGLEQDLPDSGSGFYTIQTALGYLTSCLSWADRDNKHALAEKIVDYAESSLSAKSSDWHFFYMAVMKYYYRLRETSDMALAKAEEYCIKDIELFPKYKPELTKEFGLIPNIPTFKQLAIICEKSGRIAEAISICKLALKYDISDSTKGGFSGRIAKLEKKLNQ